MSYEDEVCYDCMYYETDKCDDKGKVGKNHKACRWFKRR